MTSGLNDLRIGVIGLGAIGVCVAHGLKRLGGEPVGFSRSGIEQFEVVTKGKPATFRIANRKAVSDDLRGSFDLLIFCLKNHVLTAVADDYLTLLKDDGAVLCTQNGLMEYFLASKVGEARVLCSATTGSSELVSPGRVLEPIPVHLDVGAMSEAPDGPASKLAPLFADTPFSRKVDGALQLKWTKFVFSCVANPLSAVTGMEADRLFRLPAAQRIALGIVGEVLQLAALKGVRPARMGPFDPTWLARTSALPVPLKRGFLYVLSLGLRGIRTSMLQDIERGQKTEVEFINGWVASETAALGKQAPFSQRCVDLIRELESGSRKPGPANLEAYRDIV